MDGLEEQPADPISAVAMAPAADLSSAPAAPTLTHHAARGFAWMFGQTIVSKAAGMIGQVMMAWFLSPADYGVVGVAYAVSGIPSLIRDAGLPAILIQRQQHLKRWAGPAFWLSSVLGLLSALVMLLAAPLAARFYHEPQLFGLIAVVAVGNVCVALGTVPNTLLSIQLRFRLQSLIALVSAILIVVLNVLMAWRHCGAYSFVVPTVVVGAGRTAFVWVAAPYRISTRMYIRRWRFLIGDSGVLLLSAALGIAIAQGDYLILGKIRGQNVTGIFFFAFNLSWQTLTLLTVSLGGVLFSTLAKLQSEPERLVLAYLRAARVLAVVGVPACLMQAAVADPGIHLFFKTQWFAAIPIVQVLSFAMAVRVVGVTWVFLNGAQGRFTLQLAVNAILCAIFLTSVVIAAKFGAGLTVAVTEAVFFSVLDPMSIYIMLRRDGAAAAREVLSIYAAPLSAGVLAVGAAWLIVHAFPASRHGLIIKIAVILALSVGLYIPLIRTFSPATWAELISLRKRRTTG
jgi:O-antigen/teichoic acid export membrane protein